MEPEKTKIVVKWEHSHSGRTLDVHVKLQSWGATDVVYQVNSFP